MAETIAIAKGVPVEVPCGAMVFRVLRREVGDDGGVSVELHSDAEELIRFDLFRDDPHYHVPASEPQPSPIAADSASAAREFAVVAIREKLPQLLENAGFPEFARTSRDLDRAAVAQAVAQACDDAPEPGAAVHYPLTPEVRRLVGLPPE